MVRGKMRGLLGLAFLLASIQALDWPEFHTYDPEADSGAFVASGDVRFTMLTPRLVRIQKKGAKDFEDRATTAIVNRRLAVPEFTASTPSPGWLRINTSAVVINYKVGADFSADTLSVSPATSADGFPGWSFGEQDKGNLLGTIKSLDELGPTSLNCTENKHIDVHGEDLHCAWGLVSKSGWAVLDDGDTFALDASGWWSEENQDETDIYLFAHGLDFRGALADFVRVSGKAALPPRASMGLWWTRWFNINAADVQTVVQDYRSRSLPLDVFVLDMDWHVKPAWGSYSWDKNLFPNPTEAIQGYLKDQEGLITLANLHDDNGVSTSEDHHAAMAQMMGLPNSTGDIPFEICTSPAYAQALEDAVLLPLEKSGLDYWWIDWQQGGNHGGCAGLKQNPTIWTNKIRSTDHVRRNSTKRGLVLARWGGVGSHRYPVGFSGDVKGVTWASLAYQPYFSQTATNVAYGFWSHDIVGPSGSDIGDLELYTRWLQWAAYSGVFRSHDRGSSAGGCAGPFPATLTSNKCTVVKPWNVPTRFFEPNRAALARRAALIPYTYTQARAAYDTGVGPLIPMYYDFPHLEAAYGATPAGDQNQYFFGPDLIVAPIVTPASNETFLAAKKLWVPPGWWYDDVFGDFHEGAADGSTFLQREYDLGDIPLLVRSGAIIATLPAIQGDTIGVAARQYTALVFTVYPGPSGRTTVYEDDGATDAYARHGASATTTATSEYSSSAEAQVLRFNLSSKGSYPEMPETRTTELRLVEFGRVTSISVDGKPLNVPFARFGAALQTWSYDGSSSTAVVRLPSYVVQRGTTVVVSGSRLGNLPPIAGIKGMISRGKLAKAALDEVRTTPGAHKAGFGQLDRLAVASEVIAAGTGGAGGSGPEPRWAPFENAVNEVNKMPAAGTARMQYVKSLLASAGAGSCPLPPCA